MQFFAPLLNFALILSFFYSFFLTSAFAKGAKVI